MAPSLTKSLFRRTVPRIFTSGDARDCTHCVKFSDFESVVAGDGRLVPGNDNDNDNDNDTSDFESVVR